ncbi:putative FBD-associated F-box protein [Cardamine amara subsp. amara]|uniref:FBD-associated F-box protein n=1 Tax=Cardamine amara subsp. amara TaxID=228776 RepID=A0ABD1AU54_CARAN
MNLFDYSIDVSHMVCFPSLKSLCHTQVDLFDKEYLPLLLANCPALEDLTLERYHDDNIGAVSINVPSLKALSIHIESGCSSDGVEIVAPSLTYINLEDRSNKHLLIENMLKLEVAIH